MSLLTKTLTSCGRELPPRRTRYLIANGDDILRQIAALKSRLTALDRERSEIAEQLNVLARVQADEESQTAPLCLCWCHYGLPDRREDRAFPESVSRAGGRVAAPVGKPEDGEGGLRAHVPERMGPRSLRKAAG